MKRKRFTEEQIAFALTQADSGTSVEEVIRRMGVSEQACRRQDNESRSIQPWGGSHLRSLPERRPERLPNEAQRLTFRPDQNPGGRQPITRSALARMDGSG